MTKYYLLALLLAVLGGGCAKPEPSLTGGKPVEHWVQALDQPDPRLRGKAVLKLGNVGASDEAAIKAVIKALHDTDPRVRCAAVMAILKFGPQAAEARSALETLRQQDTDSNVREYAAQVLQKLPAAKT